MGKADLHIHTTYSDGEATVQAVLAAVAARGDLDLIAITDHDTIAGGLVAQSLATQHSYPFEVIVGAEISSREGHIVGLFLHEPIAPGQSAAETVAAIHGQGGLAFAAHPFFNDRPLRARRSMDSLGQLAGRLPFDAIEADNSTPFLELANLRARRFARRHHLTMLGASDAHIVPAIGKSYTRFPGHTANDLRQSICAGTCAIGTQRYSLPDLLAYLRFWLGYGRRAGQRSQTLAPGVVSGR